MTSATMLQDDPQVAKRYAKAVFEAAESKQCLNDVSAELGAVNDLFTATPELLQFFINPGIPKADKEQFLSEQFKEKVHPLVFNLLVLLLENGRLGSFSSTATRYWAMLDARNNVAWVDVTTAVPLDDDLENTIKEQVKAAFNYDVVHLKPEVDPAVLGGIKIKLGDKVIDGTYTGQLAQLQHFVQSQ